MFRSRADSSWRVVRDHQLGLCRKHISACRMYKPQHYAPLTRLSMDKCAQEGAEGIARHRSFQEIGSINMLYWVIIPHDEIQLRLWFKQWDIAGNKSGRSFGLRSMKRAAILERCQPSH